MAETLFESTLTCPRCRCAQRLVMPTDACLFFHECAGCGELLRPKPGDCCVFCSYGDVKCPPMQQSSSATPDERGTQNASLEFRVG